MKTKIGIFTGLLLLMVTYISWIFYMSEPKYIDNAKTNSQDNLQRYDIVSSKNEYDNECLGMIIQIDSNNYKNETRAIVRNFETPYRSDNFKTITMKKIFKDSVIIGFTQDYRIIGKGTFYHKINHFIGFNIMMFTTILIIIIALIIAVSLFGLIRQILGFDPIFD
jgi:predicted RND superfamily exporter protein